MEEIAYKPDRLALIKAIDLDIQKKDIELRMRRNDRLVILGRLSPSEAKAYMEWYLETIIRG